MNGIIAKFQEDIAQEPATGRILKRGRKQLADISDSINRVGAIKAQCILMNSKVAKFIDMLYQPDTDTKLINIDPVSGRVNIPAPWGSAGRMYWGVTRSNRDVMSSYMQYLATLRRPIPLFMFDAQAWWLNLFDYKNVQMAQQYWRAAEIDVHNWKRFF